MIEKITNDVRTREEKDRHHRRRANDDGCIQILWRADLTHSNCKRNGVESFEIQRGPTQTHTHTRREIKRIAAWLPAQALEKGQLTPSGPARQTHTHSHAHVYTHFLLLNTFSEDLGFYLFMRCRSPGITTRYSIKNRIYTFSSSSSIIRAGVKCWLMTLGCAVESAARTAIKCPSVVIHASAEKKKTYSDPDSIFFLSSHRTKSYLDVIIIHKAAP